MIEEFQTFYYRLLLSLTPDVPLDENLRAFMAPTLNKLRLHCGAKVAIHLFANPLLNEMHVMTVGDDPATKSALRGETRFRHGDPRGRRIHQLPAYERLPLTNGAAIQSLCEFRDPTPRVLGLGQLRWLFDSMLEASSSEPAEAVPGSDDVVIAIPLGTGNYTRLGAFILWLPSDGPRRVVDDHLLKDLISFRKSFEQVMISLFTNMYGMAPITYLPSYQRPGAKKVALLCAEIRDFDRLCGQVVGRGEGNAECLAQLVTAFTRTAADLVEDNEGRVDQTWGSGILAVFGEHDPAENEEVATVACMRGLTTAAEFVRSFKGAANKWLVDEFGVSSFQRNFPGEIRVEAAVLVHFGEVIFHHVGSSRHQSYMAIGEGVDFAKDLVAEAHRDAVIDNAAVLEKPIILSQTVYTRCKHMLKDLPGARAGDVDEAHKLPLPGRAWPYPVYYVCPDNIMDIAR